MNACNDKLIYMNFKTYLHTIDLLKYIPDNIMVNDLLEDNQAILVDEDFPNKPYKIIGNDIK